MPTIETLRACPCCGLIQTVPPVGPGKIARCTRCRSGLVRRSIVRRSRSRTAAFAVAALILFPVAITLPLLEITRFGHISEVSVLEGVSTLFGHGEWFLGLVVGLCSVVLPFGKLVALLLLAGGAPALHERHRALTYHVVEWTGRWGMLDVLLVALLVAAMKMGDLLDVTPGPGAAAFAVMVVLSLCAAAVFDPHTLWEPARAARPKESTNV